MEGGDGKSEGVGMVRVKGWDGKGEGVGMVRVKGRGW